MCPPSHVSPTPTGKRARASLAMTSFIVVKPEIIMVRKTHSNLHNSKSIIEDYFVHLLQESQLHRDTQIDDVFKSSLYDIVNAFDFSIR